MGVGQVFDMNNEEAGSLSTFYMMLSMIAGNLVGGIWADWWASKIRSGRFWVQGFALVLWIPALVAIGFTNNPPLPSCFPLPSRMAPMSLGANPPALLEHACIL